MGAIVALSGFMGSGKSVVGREAAGLLGWGFVDLDEAIEGAAPDTIGALFASEGEKGFRIRETSMLATILAAEAGRLERGSSEGLVLSLGGGVVTVPANVRLLKENAWIILLAVSAETAWKRVWGSERPLVATYEGFVELLRERTSAYLDSADVIVDTDQLPVSEVARRVVRAVESLGTTIE